MPGHFKKRRHAPGPSKNEEKIMRARRAENQTRLGSRHAAVRQLRAELVFLDAHQTELDRKAVTRGPSDAASLSFSCPGLCGRSVFDLEPLLLQNVASRAPSFEVGLKCAAQVASSGQPCGCELKGRIDIDYFPAENPAPGA